MGKHDLARVAVVGFDVHHGNGTEEILEGDENFLFISVHVTGENFYPGTGTKEEKSHSNVLNIAMDGNKQRSQTQFRKAFDGPILQRLKAFRPDLIIISAGFDGHKGDPVSASVLTERDYFDVTLQMCQVADEMSNCKVVSVLEGGYDIDEGSLANAVESHVLSLVVPTEKQQLLLDQAKRMNREQLRSKVKSVLEGDDDFVPTSPRASPRREKSPAKSPRGNKSPSRRERSPGREKSPKREKSPSKSPTSPRKDTKKRSRDDGGDVEDVAFSPPLSLVSPVTGGAAGGGEKKARAAKSVDEDAEVDILDDEEERGKNKRKSVPSNEESQEGTAREGPDLEIDFEMSEKSFTEAVEGRIKPSSVSSKSVSEERKGFVAPLSEVKKVVVDDGRADVDDDVDMDEINALIG